MKILVTGCLGYVGPSVLRRLRAVYPSAQLCGIDAGFFADQHDDLSPAPEIALDELAFIDVRDIEVSHFEGVSHMVHLAAISNDPMGDRFAALTHDINQVQSLRLAELARSAGVKSFTFASSASVYGAGGSTPRNEFSDLDPQTAYARSKVATEQGLAELAGKDFLVTCLRFSTACGWSPRVRLDLVLNDFVASAVASAEIVVLSDGTPWRPLIHVRDMARAIDWSISKERLEYGFYVVANVGRDDWNFQVRDLATAVAGAIGDVEVSINKEAMTDKRSYRVDFDLWRRLAPNHQPMESLSSTIAEMSEQLTGVKDLDAEFRRSTRIRLHRLQQLTDRGYLSHDLRWIQGVAK